MRFAELILLALLVIASWFAFPHLVGQKAINEIRSKLDGLEHRLNLEGPK